MGVFNTFLSPPSFSLTFLTLLLSVLFTTILALLVLEFYLFIVMMTKVMFHFEKYVFLLFYFPFQIKFFEMLEFLVFNLNFVPCKELISVSILIKSQQ